MPGEKEVDLSKAYNIHEEVDKFLERNAMDTGKMKKLIELLKE